MSKKTLQSAKAQVEFKVARLTSKLAELSDKIKRASTLYDDTVKRDSKVDTYKYRISTIRRYLEELQEIQSILDTPEYVVHIVPKSTATRQIDKSDFVNVEFDGEFVQLTLIQNYPSEDYYLVTLAPLAQF